MEKYSILIIRGEVGTGGVARSTMTLLSMINYNKTNVDLLILNQKDPALGEVPPQVNRIRTKTRNPYGTWFYKKSWRDMCKTPFLLLRRILSHVLAKMFRNNYYKYRYILRDRAIGLQKKYDMVLAMQDNSSLLYMIKKTQAVQKVFWYHIWEYNPTQAEFKFHKQSFLLTNKIFTVSSDMCEKFRKNFSESQDKINVLKNPVNSQYVIEKSTENIKDLLRENRTKIITVGRLSKEKGFDLAVVSCSQLIKRGFSVSWYIVGEGPYRRKIEELIHIYGLEKHFTLLGKKNNPYPYMKQADIYVQPSYVETFCYTIAEAKILNLPVVSTETLGAKTQIINHYNGILTDITSEAISKGIIRLIKDKDLMYKITNNLKKDRYINDDFFNKIM